MYGGWHGHFSRVDDWCGAAGSGPGAGAVDISDALISVIDLGAGHYAFSEAGWIGGAMVTGSFSGVDLDNDLQINSFDGEISAFSMSFSGNARAQAFSLGLDDLYGLVFDLDNAVLGDGIDGTDPEGIFAVGINRLYAAGPGSITVCGEGVVCAAVANVPEPASWAMLIAGFGLTGAALRRRRYLAV